MPSDRQTMVISNNTARLADIRRMVSEGIDAAGFPGDQRNKVMLAVDEAVTNIIEHAFPNVPANKGVIHLTQLVEEDFYRIEIVDDGMLYFDSNNYGDVDIEKHVAEGNKGGLGVFLMRRIMDVVEYSFESNRRNRLILMKYAD